VRVDAKGIVWFTVAFSNHVGRFDPVSKEMKVLTLPQTSSTGVACCPVPYGIDVHPLDGSIWYTKLFADKIGRIDPTTLAITEIDSPVEGPRRQRFDRAGNLWITGFSQGEIARLDTRSMRARVYPLPQFAPGEVPSPYALAIHPATQDVWVNDVNTDHAYRFIPGEERFVAYPMPLRGTYTRDFTFTKAGWACTANNPIPAAALEGQTPELICIDPGD
jgi:streptogramin lyase